MYKAILILTFFFSDGAGGIDGGQSGIAYTWDADSAQECVSYIEVRKGAALHAFQNGLILDLKVEHESCNPVEDGTQS